MDEKSFATLIKQEFEKAKKKTDSHSHAVLDETCSKIMSLLEDHDLIHLEELPHPHPRSRDYRCEPKDWKILDTTYDKVFTELLEKKKPHKKPACVFDLDGTLFDVNPRTLSIINHWLHSPEAKKHSPRLLQRVAQINYHHIGYSLIHAFENAGFNLLDEEMLALIHDVEKEWKKKFFTGTYLLEYDTVIKGAVEFVTACHKEGIMPLYLTGRYESHMREATLMQLKKFNFPFEEELVFLKKEMKGQEDHLFKAQMMKEFCKDFEVLGNFENEYINLGHMASVIPNATHVILDSHHSGRIAPYISYPVLRLRHFG
jgi:phosphoglycolate phosphatase-like HAD superfamily hydrolase